MKHRKPSPTGIEYWTMTTPLWSCLSPKVDDSSKFRSPNMRLLLAPKILGCHTQAHAIHTQCRFPTRKTRIAEDTLLHKVNMYDTCHSPDYSGLTSDFYLSNVKFTETIISASSCISHRGAEIGISTFTISENVGNRPICWGLEFLQKGLMNIRTSDTEVVIKLE